MRGNTNDRVVYSFTFQENEKTIKIKFYNRTNNIFCGSDHAASHRLRRSWALSILDNKSWTWINLPKHEYIDFLTHKYPCNVHWRILNITTKELQSKFV